VEVPIRFPDEREKIFREAEAFRRLSPDERMAAIMDVIALGLAMIRDSPNREAIEQLQREHEEAWRKAQKELFARLGV